MISFQSVYHVVSVMVQLFVPIILGYGSIKWWKLIEPQQCDSINKFLYYFTLPFFTFQFTSHVNPFTLNYKFIGADIISKGIIIIVLVIWVKCTKGSLDWSITSYSLATMNNTLIIGIPLLQAMYGHLGKDLVLQSAVVQIILWTTILLVVLEVRRSENAIIPAARAIDVEAVVIEQRPSFWQLAKIVLVKLVKNPNVYSCVIGLVWALLSNKWHFKMPAIVDNPITVMSNATSATAMFSVGLFMALQEKVISCGATLTVYGLILRFVAGPAAMGIGAIIVGLRGNALRIAIIQAALPQSVTSFVFAREYALHPQVMSTAVILGTMISLPILIAYYAVLEVIH